MSSGIWASGCSSGTAPNPHNPGSSYKVPGPGLFEASGQPHMCSDGEKKSQKVREHPQRGEINTRAHTGLILGLGYPARVTLPASNIPGMERGGDWTILRVHLKCRKNDQHVGNSPGKTLQRAHVSVGTENQWTSFGKHLVVTIKAKHTYTQ